MTTLLIDALVRQPEGARSEDDRLWIPAAVLESATGWALKPEGMCQGDVCVPIPAGREDAFVRDGAVDFAAFARYLGRPVVADAATDTRAVGESAEDRSESLRSLQAPDFELPDLAGKHHKLSDYRGRRIFLASWASW
jgi:hypothetical protein